MPLRRETLYASYRRLERPLYNVLFRLLWQAEDCQDILHDAYVRLWERRDKVDESGLDNLAWTTALNLARNRLRWRGLRRHEPVDEGLATPDGTADYLAAHQLRRALKALPADSRDVLLLAEFGGLGNTEIASVLGIPVGTVASRKHHAVRRLKTLLGEPAHA